MSGLSPKRAKAAQGMRCAISLRGVLCATFLALVFALSSIPAVAQGCAMCYATAKATPKDGQRALNRAILVMVLPPIGAITLGVGAAIRYSKKRDREKNDHEG
jgi:hypothetical protein